MHNEIFKHVPGTKSAGPSPFKVFAEEGEHISKTRKTFFNLRLLIVFSAATALFILVALYLFPEDETPNLSDVEGILQQAEHQLDVVVREKVKLVQHLKEVEAQLKQVQKNAALTKEEKADKLMIFQKEIKATTDIIDSLTKDGAVHFIKEETVGSGKTLMGILVSSIEKQQRRC